METCCSISSQLGAETAELHQLSLDLDSLAGTWRDLNRPGNDVLENFEVEAQRAALDRYKQRYDAIHASLQQRLQGDNALLPIIISLGPARDTLVDLAEQVLALSGQREALRLAQAQTGLILEKETAAASAMAVPRKSKHCLARRTTSGSISTNSTSVPVA